MNKHYKICFLALFLAVYVNTALWAQEVLIRGTVSDATDGAGLPGVNILQKGTTSGTTTDINGDYSISVERGSTLVYSFVGYLTEEVLVGNQSTINVGLTADVRSLGEVVVVGYGTQRKADVTGSVAAVDSREFNKGVMASPQELLLGKVAGVNIVSSGGAPGAGAMIRIRGGSSLSASNDPLIVIDGFPVDNTGIAGSPNPLATINPNDIETFTILKDASATAIYGSRASNGVIIITTKKGKQEGLQVNYNGTLSINQPVRFIDVLSGDEVRALTNQLFEAEFSGIDEATLARLGNENTDWQSEVFRTSISHDHNLAVSGALINIPYRVSFGHTNQQGILKTTEMIRNTINVNLNPSFFNNHLTLNANLKTSFSKHNFGEQGAVGAAVAFDPTQPVRNNNNRYGGFFTWTNLADALPDGSNNPEGNRNPIGVANPVALLEQTDNRSNVNRTIGNLQADYRFTFLPELSVNLNTGFDRASGVGFRNIDPNAGFLAGPEHQLNDYSSITSSELFDIYLNYRKSISNHRIDATAGYSWQHFQREGSTYIRNVEETNIQTDIAYKNENYLVSFFGRFNYSFNDRYLLTLTLRNDGSSRFSEENRWGLFPAVAVGWNISEEGFLRDSRAISDLKLRASYGVTGQQDIGGSYYPYLATYTESITGAFYQFGNTFYNTLRPDPYDVNIKWEETTTANIGLDFGFINNRLTGAIEVYHRITDDLLNFIPIAAGSNFSNFLMTNVGSLENKGVEVSLNGHIVQRSNLAWSIGANFTRNENRITKLTMTDDPDYAGVNTGGISGGVGNMIQNHQVGFPAFSFHVFEQVYNAEGRPIEGLYVDRSGQGGSVTSNELNKFRYQDPAPQWQMGLNTNARFGNFDIFMAGRIFYGNYVYNNVFSDRAVYSALYNQSGFINNLPTAVNETQFADPQYFSSHYVENASFFRMDNVSLGYNVNQIFHERLRGRFSLTVQNAFVITNYSGLDPEVAGGIDNNIYPRPRVFLFGFNLTL